MFIVYVPFIVYWGSVLVFVLLCITLCLFSFAIILTRSERQFLCFIDFLMYCYCQWSEALPYGAVGWYAVCGCGISWPYSPIGTASADSAKFRGFRPGMYIEDLLWWYFLNILTNRNCLGRFCEIPWNQTRDVHRGSTLITRVKTWHWRYITWCWRQRNHINTITSVLAAKIKFMLLLFFFQ